MSKPLEAVQESMLKTIGELGTAGFISGFSTGFLCSLSLPCDLSAGIILGTGLCTIQRLNLRNRRRISALRRNP